MLTQDNNNMLFKNPKIEELYISQENNLNKLKQIIKEKDNIILRNKIDHDNLKIEYNSLESKFIESCNNENDLYESNVELINHNNYYEKQFDFLNSFFKDNNINSLTELKNKISNIISNSIDYNYLFKKYDKLDYILENTKINFQSQKLKMDELFNNFEYLYNKIKKIKNKINILPIGTILKINGVKKIFKGKIENHINKIKMVQEDFDEYCNKQIQWARGILGNEINDSQIIKLLDILNKLNKSYTEKSDSEGEISDIFNEMENIEVQRYNMLFKLGNSFIKKDISDKSQIPDIIKDYKKIIYSYDSKDKINRFISTSKRMYKISILINTENIIKSKCMTSIRDISNDSFDNLLILLENYNKNV